jgi:hypothetical protein
MAKKMLVSLAMEGKFDEGGLHSFEGDDDVLTAMARELVTEHGVGEFGRCPLASVADRTK